MSNSTLLTVALPVVGGLSWLLVAAARIDLVVRLTGNRFGDTDAASRARRTAAAPSRRSIP